MAIGDTAYRLRKGLLVVGSLCVLAGVAWAVLAPPLQWGAGLLGSQLVVFDGDSKGKYWTNVAVVVGLFFLSQWWFLRPRRGWAPTLTLTGRPMKRAVVIAACLSALISMSVLGTALELVGGWEGFVKLLGNSIINFWGVIAVMWAAWGVVFFLYWRQGDRYTQLGRMIRGLLAGSFLAFLVAVPVQITAPRRQNCYCALGSYTGLVLAGTVLLWCFGPGLVLLFLREKYRAEKLRQGQSATCPRCGYDLQGTLAAGRDTCPECGTAIPQ